MIVNKFWMTRCEVRAFSFQVLLVLIGYTVVFGQGPPPAKVVVSEIYMERVAENRPFIGRLYYDTASQISSEIVGLVEIVAVRSGEILQWFDHPAGVHGVAWSADGRVLAEQVARRVVADVQGGARGPPVLRGRRRHWHGRAVGNIPLS